MAHRRSAPENVSMNPPTSTSAPSSTLLPPASPAISQIIFVHCVNPWLRLSQRSGASAVHQPTLHTLTHTSQECDQKSTGCQPPPSALHTGTNDSALMQRGNNTVPLSHSPSRFPPSASPLAHQYRPHHHHLRRMVRRATIDVAAIRSCTSNNSLLHLSTLSPNLDNSQSLRYGEVDQV